MPSLQVISQQDESPREKELIQEDVASDKLLEIVRGGFGLRSYIQGQRKAVEHSLHWLES